MILSLNPIMIVWAFVDVFVYVFHCQFGETMLSGSSDFSSCLRRFSVLAVFVMCFYCKGKFKVILSETCRHDCVVLNRRLCINNKAM